MAAPQSNAVNEEEQNVSAVNNAYFQRLQEWYAQSMLAQNLNSAMYYANLFDNYNRFNQVQQQQAAAVAEEHNQTNEEDTEQSNRNIGAGFNERPAVRPGYLNEEEQRNFIYTYGGILYTLAPLSKRILAEAIDILLLYLWKMMLGFLVFLVFGLNVGALGTDIMPSRNTISYDDFFKLTWFELLVELISTAIECLLEAMFTAWHDGATPGKWLMKINIIYVEAVLPIQDPFEYLCLQPVLAIVNPAKTPTLPRAFMRALTKNLSFTILHPIIAIIMLLLEDYRTPYDRLTKTIVVDATPAGLFVPNE